MLFFFLELLLDASQPCNALLTLQHRRSFAALEVFQMLSDELQVALLAALDAIIRVAIPRAEATVSAKKADSLAFVFLGVVKHILVELVSLQQFLAGVALARVGVVLAGDAIFCIALERSWILLLSARCAGMAAHAAEGPIL